MKEDVMESNNLFLEKPEIVKQMKVSLEEVVKSGSKSKK
jgi:hypothetical protein